MKVVINRCYGGFGLSVAAMKRLIEMGSPVVKKTTLEAYAGSSVLRQSLRDVGDGYARPTYSNVLFKGDFVYSLDFNVNRADDSLVRVVEELGKAADGEHAELQVAEIPDGIEWEISEYDGIETIEEKHRSWP